MIDCIIYGCMGWFSIMMKRLEEEGTKCTYIPARNAIYATNITKSDLEASIGSWGFGGGEIIEINR